MNAYTPRNMTDMASLASTPLTYARTPQRDAEALVRKHLPLVRRLAWHIHGSMSTIVEGPRTLMISSEEDEAGRVQVVVADTGAGLDPDAAQRLFEPFFSTKPRGLGMGLAISRSIVESHGGRIVVSPNAPRGTVFRFSLPAARSTAA